MALLFDDHKYWQNLLKIYSYEYALIEDNLKFYKFKIGEQLYKINEYPTGILFLIKGNIRLIEKDNNGEVFTIKKYKEGEIVGAVPILQARKDTSLLFSTDSEGYFLKSNIFLKLYYEIENFQKNFELITKEEYFSIFSKSNLPNLLSRDDLLIWSNEQVYKKEKVKLFPPGKHILQEKNKTWIISSNNIKDKSIGELIDSNSEFVVTGKIKCRLIPLKFDLPQKALNNNVSRLKINDPKKQNENTVEALEDLYGSIKEEQRFPDNRGLGVINEPLICLRMICLFLNIPFRRDLIRKILKEQISKSNKPISIHQLAAISDLIGLKSTIFHPNSIDNFKLLPLPSIYLYENHPIIIWRIKNNKVLISDPKKGQEVLNIEYFISKKILKNSGFLFCEATKFSPKSKFGFNWFLPSIKKFRFSLFQVVIASFFVQLLALFNPLLIQQIIDAVINQGSIKSLNVLGVLLIAMALSQALLTTLRTYLFSDTTNRIDLSLGSSIINHLFRLPINYFTKRQVGEVSSRIGELEKIRSFLTGTALTILLDSLFSFIYIAVMLIYSVTLTIWALSIIPLYVLLTILISPIIRTQLKQKAEANARVNSHIVETISGIETVKAQGMEIASEWRWKKLYNKQISAGFKNILTSTAASSTSTFLQQFSGLIVIWVGATLVLKGQLTLGQLIAFRILASYVTNPLLRIATLWQDFQEISISINRLSDVVDNPEEIEITGKNLPPIPPIKGKIIFEKVNFGFDGDRDLQLKNINLDIMPGQFVGIVGESGSGKSTLLKVLTKFYEPNKGIIKIDDFDLSKIDLYSYRNQLGIVPQDSLLFEGTISSNISISKPEASYEEIISAAKLACAHDFIELMPSGYNQIVRERGVEMSGGQRQRIAIARMILGKPQMLILDEATSSLDIETEEQLVNNLLRVFNQKTVLFISHRLRNLTKADKIIVMNQGIIIEEGSFNELKNKKGYFAHLISRNK